MYAVVYYHATETMSFALRHHVVVLLHIKNWLIVKGCGGGGEIKKSKPQDRGSQGQRLDNARLYS